MHHLVARGAIRMHATHSGALQVRQHHFVVCLSPFRFQQFLQFVRSPSNQPGRNARHSVPASGRARLRDPVDSRLSSPVKCSTLMSSFTQAKMKSTRVSGRLQARSSSNL